MISVREIAMRLSELRTGCRSYDWPAIQAEVDAAFERQVGITDIIIRELEHDDEAMLANDYGGTGWEKSEEVVRARKVHALHHKEQTP